MVRCSPRHPPPGVFVGSHPPKSKPKFKIIYRILTKYRIYSIITSVNIKYTDMKKQLSVTLDQGLYNLIKHKPNLSRYIEELVKQDLQQKQVKSIVKGVVDDLLTNEPFINELSMRISYRQGQSTNHGVEVDPNPNWGA